MGCQNAKTSKNDKKYIVSPKSILKQTTSPSPSLMGLPSFIPIPQEGNHNVVFQNPSTHSSTNHNSSNYSNLNSKKMNKKSFHENTVTCNTCCNEQNLNLMRMCQGCQTFFCLVCILKKLTKNNLCPYPECRRIFQNDWDLQLLDIEKHYKQIIIEFFSNIDNNQNSNQNQHVIQQIYQLQSIEDEQQTMCVESELCENSQKEQNFNNNNIEKLQQTYQQQQQQQQSQNQQRLRQFSNSSFWSGISNNQQQQQQQQQQQIQLNQNQYQINNQEFLLQNDQFYEIDQFFNQVQEHIYSLQRIQPVYLKIDTPQIQMQQQQQQILSQQELQSASSQNNVKNSKLGKSGEILNKAHYQLQQQFYDTYLIMMRNLQQQFSHNNNLQSYQFGYQRMDNQINNNGDYDNNNIDINNNNNMYDTIEFNQFQLQDYNDSREEPNINDNIYIQQSEVEKQSPYNKYDLRNQKNHISNQILFKQNQQQQSIIFEEDSNVYSNYNSCHLPQQNNGQTPKNKNSNKIILQFNPNSAISNNSCQTAENVSSSQNSSYQTQNLPNSQIYSFMLKKQQQQQMKLKLQSQ